MKHIRRVHFAFIIALILTSVLAYTAMAQSRTELDDGARSCNVMESVYRDGAVVYTCQIVNDDGTYYVNESFGDDKIIQRVATQSEIRLYQKSISERACLVRHHLASAALATPRVSTDITELARRIDALETLITEDDC